MCVVSNVTDYWQNQPAIKPFTVTDDYRKVLDGVSRREFDELKRQVIELKELLVAAKKFDEKTGQPGCEMEDKVKLVKGVADALGVDMSKVFEQ